MITCLFRLAYSFLLCDAFPAFVLTPQHYQHNIFSRLHLDADDVPTRYSASTPYSPSGRHELGSSGTNLQTRSSGSASPIEPLPPPPADRHTGPGLGMSTKSVKQEKKDVEKEKEKERKRSAKTGQPVGGVASLLTQAGEASEWSD